MQFNLNFKFCYNNLTCRFIRNGIHKHNAIDVRQYAINQNTFFGRLENNAVLCFVL